MKSKLLVVLFLVFSIMAASVMAEVEGEAVVASLLNQDPDPAIAGDIMEIRIGVENLGDTASEDFVLEISPEYPFEEVQGESLTEELGIIAGNVAGSNIKIVKFKVRVNKEATAGSYNLPVYLYEEGKKDPNLKNLFTIDIESTESAEIIYIDQVELIPGHITPMTFTINNVGSTPLRELTFQWENEDDIILPVGSDNTKYIKYIDVGESAELKFDVIASANADPDLYKLDLTLTYEDPLTGTEKELNTKAGVYVGGATDFDVAFSGSSSGEYSFSISNIGSVSATSVTVKIPDQQGWRVSGSNSVIIGNLNEGDYTIAGFNLAQSGGFFTSQDDETATRPTSMNFTQRTSGSNQNLKIDIVYTDSRGNRNTITKEVSVASSSATSDASTTDTTSMRTYQNSRFTRQSPLQQFWNTAKWALAAIAVLVLGFFVRRNYKAGKRRDVKYTYRRATIDTLLFWRKKHKK
ncbi:COG1361 S-layer family protein [Candidatus Woesearchaeota archaeon]|nr:COG1361 S-layer family protein [Candidatus Woesearchaeota archaeon]